MPAFKTRGVMLDPAREMEKKSYYTFILPWLKEWGYNTLHLHLTDDQGCALQFPSHPEFGTTGSYTADEMRAFIKSARKLGIDVIPEIESLGHTRFITQSSRYKHLGGDRTGQHGFNAIDPEHPDTRKVLKDIFEDTARIFASDIIHTGLDEVDFSTLPRYMHKSRTDCWKVFSRHAAWTHETIRRAGKRPAMWGDHILMTPEMASDFKRDVLIFDWHYDPDFSPSSLDFFCKQKFEVWGAPATMCWRARILSNETNLSNVREFTAHARNYRRKGVTGMINTVWCPWRYLSGAMDWPIALAGHLFSVEKEDPAFCIDFCRSFYGMSTGNARVMADLLKSLHKAVPISFFQGLVVSGKGYAGPFTAEHARRCGEIADDFTALVKTLSPMVRKAKRNAERLNDIVISARILKRLGQFGAANRQRSKVPADPLLRKTVYANWDRIKAAPAHAVVDVKKGLLENILNTTTLIT